jgi:glyoxylase-like metal-dependent hydrolase (beta-lactamase superfamily II)
VHEECDVAMIERNYLFPGVIEMNYQARRRMGVNVYLIDGGSQYALIDVGFLDELSDVLELTRQMDFSLSACKLIVATHADVDHAQGLARAREILKCPVVAHPRSVQPLEQGDEILTYARIDAQGIQIPMPRCKVDQTIDEGDRLLVGDRTLEVWSTPGHTAGQLAFRMGNLLFSGDNIFRDGCVGVIDAHHGSNLVDFIASLKRIRACDVDYLLPSHGPIFRKDDALLDATIARLQSYTHMADFGTCATDWPLLDQWEDELAQGKTDF